METWHRLKGERVWQAYYQSVRELAASAGEKIPISWDKMQFFVGITLQINFKESRFFDICRHNKKKVYTYFKAPI